MHTLRSHPAARAGSLRRWATGAVIAVTLLVEVPRAPDLTDRTSDPVTDVAVDPRAPCAACERLTGDAPPCSPPAPIAPIAPAAGGSAGTSHRFPLHHVIGL